MLAARVVGQVAMAACSAALEEEVGLHQEAALAAPLWVAVGAFPVEQAMAAVVVVACHCQEEASEVALVAVLGAVYPPLRGVAWGAV